MGYIISALILYCMCSWALGLVLLRQRFPNTRIAQVGWYNICVVVSLPVILALDTIQLINFTKIFGSILLLLALLLVPVIYTKFHTDELNTLWGHQFREQTHLLALEDERNKKLRAENSTLRAQMSIMRTTELKCRK